MSHNPADLTGAMGEHTHVTHLHIQDTGVPPFSISLNTWGRGGDPFKGWEVGRIDIKQSY